MKLAFKTLKGEQFTLEVALEDTVLHVKTLVSERQSNAGAAAGYRLIYAGKVLKDRDTLESAGVKATGFVVVMPPAKAKPAVRPAANNNGASAAPIATATPVTSGAQAPPAANADSGPAAPVTTPTAAAATAASPPAIAITTPTTGTTAAVTAAAPATVGADPDASLLTGDAYEASVRQICEMGFPEDQARRAMRAAFNNPGRAVEYLFSGIPDVPETAPAEPPTASHAPRTPAGGQNQPAATGQQQQQPNQQASRTLAPGTPFDMFGGPGVRPDGVPMQNPVGATGGVGADTTPTQAQGASGGTGNLDFLRQLPQFNLMRRMIQANPGLLQQLLHQLDQANPALLSVINANQDEFVRLINEQPPPGEEGGDEAMEQLAAALANAGGGVSGVAPPGQIYVTEDENEQLIRLTELGQTMGLHRMHVVEAWLACDRDENMAANYLYDHMEEIKAAQEEDEAAAEQDDGTPDGNNPGLGDPHA